jgi:hypothetical protein
MHAIETTGGKRFPSLQHHEPDDQLPCTEECLEGMVLLPVKERSEGLDTRTRSSLDFHRTINVTSYAFLLVGNRGLLSRRRRHSSLPISY